MDDCLWVIGFLEEIDFKANLPVKFVIVSITLKNKRGTSGSGALAVYLERKAL